MLGKPVVNRRGRTVGRIKDLIFEPSRGLLAYVKLELEEDRHLNVPYNSVTVREEEVEIDLPARPGAGNTNE